MSLFGPEYQKINSIWERDGKGIILPDRWATPEISYLSLLPWHWTEKVDGTNIRLHWNGSEVTVGGRTDRAQVPATLLSALKPWTAPGIWQVTFPEADDVTIYGEGYGARIQKGGGNYRPDQGFIMFDVRVGDWWLTDDGIEDVAAKMGFDIVPFFGTFSVVEAWDLIRLGSLNSAWPGVTMEGLVGRPATELYNRRGQRVIAKVKAKDRADYLKAQEKKENNVKA